MKAEEIRVEQDKVKTYGRAATGFGKETVDHMTCWILHEVAAQLAELNENFRQIIGHEKTYRGGYVGGVRLIRDF